MSEADPSAVDWAVVERHVLEARTWLQRAADAALSCRGGAPSDVADDAARTGEYGAALVGVLHGSLLEGSAEQAVAADAWSAASDGVAHLRYAILLEDLEAAQPSYDAAHACFERAMHLIGW